MFEPVKCTGRVRAGDLLHEVEQFWKGIVVRTFGGAEDDLVGVVEAEGDGVAILEFTTFDFFAIDEEAAALADRKSTRLNSSHSQISYAVFCLKKKKK